MLPIRIILHPTDFSDPAVYALDMASSLARDYSARLVILHVYHLPPVFAGEGMVPAAPDEFRAEADEQLQRLQLPHANLRVERRLKEGDAANEILQVSEESNADLIVMGTHGRTGLRRVLVGSVAEQVVRQASCPVVTVSAPYPQPAIGTTNAESMAAAAL